MKSNTRYTLLFKDYRKRRKDYLARNPSLDDREGLFDTIEGLLADYDDGDIDKLEDYFANSQNPKRNAHAILVEFNEYIMKKHHIEFPDIPEVTNLFSSHIERHMQLLKEMHEPKKVSELAQSLHLGNVATNHYIKDLENGYVFMDTEIKVDVHREHRQDRCRSVVHPVFLALNSTELSHLLTYLQQTDDVVLGRIGNLVYSQLTDYAKKVICSNITSFSDRIVPNYDDEFERTNDDAMGFLVKRAMMEKPFDIEFEYSDENGNFIATKGKLVGRDFNADTYKIITDDGKELHLAEDEFYVNTEVLYS